MPRITTPHYKQLNPLALPIFELNCPGQALQSALVFDAQRELYFRVIGSDSKLLVSINKCLYQCDDIMTGAL
ncbi:MAG: hypothetical protein NVS2B12_11910 [Ktedonobacteraceae bacterium]